MKDSIVILQSLNVTSLRDVDRFVGRLREEFKKIIPSDRDPVKQAENLIDSLLKVVGQRDNDYFIRVLPLLERAHEKLPSDRAASEDGYLITEFYQAINTLRHMSPQERACRHAVLTLPESCEECEAHLKEIIVREAKKLPSGGAQYFHIESDKIAIGEIDVDALSADLYHKKRHFADRGLYDKRASRELVEAVKSYEATKRLHATLKAGGMKANDKLNAFKQEYDKTTTKQDLQSNPDPKVKTFFKVVGYVLANIFTGGALHFATKGSFLMSKPQKLGKRAKEVVEEVNNPKKRKR